MEVVVGAFEKVEPWYCHLFKGNIIEHLPRLVALRIIIYLQS